MTLLDRNPALWIGAILLVAVGLAVGWGTAVFPWIVLLLFPWLKRKQWLHFFAASLLFTTVYYYAYLLSPISRNIEERGIGYFSPNEVREEESPFGKQLVYIGTMLHFRSDHGNISHNLPCRIYVKGKKRVPADGDYLIKGKLLAKKHNHFVCKPEENWLKVKNTFSLAEWRYRSKQKARRYLERHFHGSRAAPLFSALTLGTIDERQLSLEFRNLGLSHLLAISGFHFALYAGTLLLLLRPFLSKKATALTALLLLSGYAFFLGSSPSVMRAWSAISLILVGRLMGWRTTGLNALGVGLIAELLFDPLLISHLGFQLSFLATAAILLLYAPCEKFLQKLFLARSMSEVKILSLFDRHLYLLSSFLRKAIALNIAVHLVAIPSCLLHFQSFPWLSFFYNLFYPLLISLGMVALLAGVAAGFLIPPFGDLVHHLNKSFTEGVLGIIAHHPFGEAWTLHTGAISPWIFSLWALLLLLFKAQETKKNR